MANDDLLIAGVIVAGVGLLKLAPAARQLAAEAEAWMSYLSGPAFWQPVLSYGLFGAFLVAGAAGLFLLLKGSLGAVGGLFAMRKDICELYEDLEGSEAENAGWQKMCDEKQDENTRLARRLEASEALARKQLAEIERLASQKADRPQDYTIRIRGDEPLYALNDLNEAEADFLERQGYTRHKLVGIHSPGPQVWLLKGSSRESPEHFFLVHHIAEYLRPRSAKVELFETRGPDIVFTASDGRKVALEIETGSLLASDTARLREKVAELNRSYGKDWAIVITHSDLLKAYGAFGQTFTKGQIKALLGRYLAHSGGP